MVKIEFANTVQVFAIAEASFTIYGTPPQFILSRDVLLIYFL